MNTNIFFLLGCPCSGKTTVGKMLVSKYDMLYFSGDDKRFDYYKKANPAIHKFMTMDTSNFWNWSLEDMIAWERGVIREQTPMVLEDLIKLSEQHKYVLFEGMLDMDYLSKAVPKEQIVFLTVSRKVCEKVFFDRFDHSNMVDMIMREEGVSDVEKSRRIQIRRQAAIDAFYLDGNDYGIQSFSRTNMTHPSEMLEKVEGYFKLYVNED